MSYHHWVTYCVLLEDLLRSKYTSPVNHLVNMKIQSKRNKNLQASLTGESSIRGAGDANNIKGYNYIKGCNSLPFCPKRVDPKLCGGMCPPPPSAHPPSGVPVLPTYAFTKSEGLSFYTDFKTVTTLICFTTINADERILVTKWLQYRKPFTKFMILKYFICGFSFKFFVLIRY